MLLRVNKGSFISFSFQFLFLSIACIFVLSDYLFLHKLIDDYWYVILIMTMLTTTAEVIDSWQQCLLCKRSAILHVNLLRCQSTTIRHHGEYWLTGWLVEWLTDWPTYSLIHWLTCSFAHSLYLFNYLFIYLSLTQSITHHSINIFINCPTPLPPPHHRHKNI